MTKFRFSLLALGAALLSGCGTSSLPQSTAQSTLSPAPLTALARAQAVTPRNPILFVHGYISTGSIWTTMIGNFKRDGWTDAELFTWSYDYNQSNAVTADQIRQKVDAILLQTGATKVDIITHSMGGLSSRYYLKNLGGDAKVDAWVSLGGPNHGTDFANGCYSTSCTEMRLNSSFVTALNSTDETPGTPRYGTWWSPCDAVINPDSSVPLVGATNTQTACLTHNALYSNSTVYGQVRDFVR